MPDLYACSRRLSTPHDWYIVMHPWALCLRYADLISYLSQRSPLRGPRFPRRPRLHPHHPQDPHPSPLLHILPKLIHCSRLAMEPVDLALE